MTGVPSTDPEEDRDSSTRMGRIFNKPAVRHLVRGVKQVILMCICTVL